MVSPGADSVEPDERACSEQAGSTIAARRASRPRHAARSARGSGRRRTRGLIEARGQPGRRARTWARTPIAAADESGAYPSGRRRDAARMAEDSGHAPGLPGEATDARPHRRARGRTRSAPGLNGATLDAVASDVPLVPASSEPATEAPAPLNAQQSSKRSDKGARRQRTATRSTRTRRRVGVGASGRRTALHGRCRTWTSGGHLDPDMVRDGRTIAADVERSRSGASEQP